MEYYTADTYKNWTRIGEPFYDNNGKLSTKVKTVCPRCSGRGIIVARVENDRLIPIPVDGGICYSCKGDKFITKKVRLYTKAEYDTMQKNNERARQKRAEAAEAKRLAEFDTKKAKWLSDNGFDTEGNTFLYVKEDSYQKKDELKAAGYKYNPVLKWHGPAAGGFEEATEVHNVEEFYQLTAWGAYTMLSDAASKVESIIEASRPASTSEWIGDIGEKLCDVVVTLVSVYGFEGRYGFSQVVRFETEEGNVLTWFTGVDIKVKVGESCLLTGTVKKLDEYKGEKTTVMTRCKLA